ncbi:ComEA family DNA-binding protein [Galactobacter caseinivorans]|uniref:Competence protein ComEA n=1 Tax=Galactobacter caseinivorans TaxID=2676123 RepID=A0A496PKX5_9MICC|nr:ComEA family DNA-binding protein [Galactobacter caseinivorans]RKW71172.1 competence protein ComEA [Galactobacter caseinivorans]
MGRHGGDQDAQPSAEACEARDTAPWDALDLSPADRDPGAARGGIVRRHAWKALLLALLAATGVVLWRLSPSEAASGTLLPRASASSQAQLSGSPPASGGEKAAEQGVAPPGAASPAVSGAAQSPPGSAAPAAGPNVHIVGAVKKPGLYRLTAGARINDAITAAGGAKKDADLAAVNLAAPVQDGQQLRVPKRGETSGGSQGSPGSTPGGGALPPAAGGPGPQGATPGIVRINEATAEQLQELPGIGPALSARLIAFREQNGRFTSAADLDAVPGIGPAMLAKLEGLVSYD